MKKKYLQMTCALVVIGIGVYMTVNNQWPTPPAMSGAAFIFAGLGLWIPFCPICKMVCKG